jgi:hypothetical protein
VAAAVASSGTLRQRWLLFSARAERYGCALFRALVSFFFQKSFFIFFHLCFLISVRVSSQMFQNALRQTRFLHFLTTAKLFRLIVSIMATAAGPPSLGRPAVQAVSAFSDLPLKRVPEGKKYCLILFPSRAKSSNVEVSELHSS